MEIAGPDEDDRFGIHIMSGGFGASNELGEHAIVRNETIEAALLGDATLVENENAIGCV